MNKEKRVDEIIRLCAESGLSLLEVCREAKVNYGTIQKWQNKEPDAFETYDTLKDTIEVMKSKKQEAPVE